MTKINASTSPSAPIAPPVSNDLIGSSADLAFVVYAMQIQQLDSFIRSSLEEVRQIGKLREAINRRLAELRDWKAFIDEHGSGDGDAKKVTLLDHCDDPDKPQIAQVDFSIAEDGSVKATQGSALGVHSTRFILDDDGQIHQHSYHEVSMADVDREISRLQGIAEGWDGDREIKMIMMNHQLNKKEQAVTLLSNFIKTAHDVESAIINSMR